MKWLSRITSAVLVVLGLVAIAQDLPSLIRGSSDFMDFAGIGALIGVLLILLAAMALLNDRYGSVAPGIRKTGIAATAVTGLILLRMLTLDGVSLEGSVTLAAVIALLASEIASGGKARASPSLR